MTTPINLVECLATRIENLVEKYRLQTSDAPETLRAPNVLRQYLPLKKYADEPDPADYPLVSVFLSDVEVAAADERGKAQVDIICGGYDANNNSQGWRTPMDMAYRILVDLQQAPIIGAFQMQFPVTIKAPEDQPYPQWYVTLSTRWDMPAIALTKPAGF